MSFVSSNNLKVFLILKDPHFRFGFRSPIGRTDEFFTQIKDKLSQLKDMVLSLQKQEGEVYVICTGDVFDIGYPNKYNLPVIKAMESIFDEYLNDVPFLSIAGNHDLPNSSVSMKKQSIYKYFVDKGCIRDLTVEPLEIEGQNSLIVQGLDYGVKELEVTKHDKHILVLHEYCIPFSAMSLIKNDFMEYVEYRELMQRYSNIDVFVLGHLHTGFANEKVGSSLFLNGWNFSRLARDYYSLNDKHLPEINVLKYDTDLGSFKAELVKLNVTRSSEAFKEKELSALDKLNEFVDCTDFATQLKAFKKGEVFIPDNIGEGIERLLREYIKKGDELHGGI